MEVSVGLLHAPVVGDRSSQNISLSDPETLELRGDPNAADTNRHAIRPEAVSHRLKGIAGGLMHGADRHPGQDRARRVAVFAAHDRFSLRVGRD
jgi:hypothetical protein